jgi:crotonobetainyl-CoA:carnitine CoA-transferase CaiB-like acyl-CoA transferase
MMLSGEELYGLANQTQLPIFQFYPVRKLVGSDHVQARNSVVDVEIGDRCAKMPGAPFAMQVTPWTLRRPAPRLGEHNTAILGERAEVLS